MSFPTDPHLANLQQQRKRAKDLRRAHHEGQIEAAVRIARYLPRARSQSPEQVLRSEFRLSEAQFVVAREAGFSSWPSMKHHIEQAALNQRDIGELIINAAFDNNDAAVRSALKRDPVAAQRSISVAAAVADADAAFALLEHDPLLADRRGGRRSWTPLLYLCRSRYCSDEPEATAARMRIARRLIELGADVNAAGKEPGYTSPNVTQTYDEHEWYPIEAAAGRLARPEIVRLLLESGADLNKTSEVLSQAVKGGSAEVLELLLAASPPAWQVIWALKACAVLDRKNLAALLAPYIAPAATNEPAVLEAIRLERDPELIDILLGQNDDEALRNVPKNAYRAAVRYGQHGAAALLRRRGTDESAVTDVDRVIAACLDLNGRELHRLLQQSAYPLVLREDDHRILAWAIRTRRDHAVPLLIEAGLDPNVSDKDGETPLHVAVRVNAIEVINALFRAGAALDMRNFEGETPLDVAVAHHHEDVIRRLIAAGARPTPQDTETGREEMNALFERAADAVAFGDLDMLRELLDDEPALIQARSPRPHRATLLHYCGANGVESPRQRTPANAPEIARLLLERGADVNATCSLYGGGATTLGLLLTSGYPVQAGLRRTLMEILVSAGAIIDGKRGTEGIVGAAALGRLDLVTNFFNSDGTLKTNTTKPEVQSAFMWACEYGRTPVADFLLKRGVDIRLQGENGMTALHLSALAGYLDTVELLLQYEAPLELKNVWGGTVLNTALYGAVHWDPNADYVPIVATLIKAGARIKPEVLMWWAQQKTLVASAKERIAKLLHGPSPG